MVCPPGPALSGSCRRRMWRSPSGSSPRAPVDASRPSRSRGCSKPTGWRRADPRRCGCRTARGHSSLRPAVAPPRPTRRAWWCRTGSVRRRGRAGELGAVTQGVVEADAQRVLVRRGAGTGVAGLVAHPDPVVLEVHVVGLRAAVDEGRPLVAMVALVGAVPDLLVGKVLDVDHRPGNAALDRDSDAPTRGSPGGRLERQLRSVRPPVVGVFQDRGGHPFGKSLGPGASR